MLEEEKTKEDEEKVLGGGDAGVRAMSERMYFRRRDPALPALLVLTRLRES